ncbi:hypothetical protein C8J57DRAFT_1732631 [Mycena rebaudengoi]|nr:hypothetical protein C8J57DRAFT_1732631 [Mycena rebaudengoi]
MKESDSDLQEGSSTEPGQLTLQDNNRHELENRVRQLTQLTKLSRPRCRIHQFRPPSLAPGFHGALPLVNPGSPCSHFLEPICTTDVKLHAHLASWGCQDPELKAYVNHALYVPKRVVWSSPHPGLWIAGSELSGLRGTTGNLFIADDSILYVGTYNCHNLEHLHPGGTVAPEVVSPLEVMYTPHLGAMKPVDTAVVIKHFYPGGSILVGCVGLQCIGFDRSLYNALRRRRLNGGGTKRKADSDGPYNV